MAGSRDFAISRSPEQLLRVEFKTLLKLHNPEKPGSQVSLSGYEDDATESSVRRLANLGLVRHDEQNLTAALTQEGLDLVRGRPTLEALEELGPIEIRGRIYSSRGY